MSEKTKDEKTKDELSDSSSSGEESTPATREEQAESADPLSALPQRALQRWMATVSGAPDSIRAATYAAVTVAGLGAMFGSLLINANHGLGFATFCCVVLVLGWYIWWVLWNRTPENEVEWSWTVVRLPPPPDVLERLRDKLEAVRQRALTVLAARDVPANEQQVRANMFFPDYRNVPKGVAFELRMPGALRIMMRHPDEWSLALLPGEGAAGKAFLTGFPVYTSERSFNIRDTRKLDQVANLTGIVSIPIKGLGSEHVIAVVNIDVINTPDPVPGDALRQVHVELIDSTVGNLVDPIATELARLPRAEVSIGIKRVSSGAGDGAVADGAR